MNLTVAGLAAHSTALATQTITLHAAADIVSMSHEIYYLIAAVCGTAAMATGMIVGLRKAWKVGIGAGIAMFFGGVAFSILIANAVGIRDIGNNELENRTGIHQQSSYYGR